MSVTTSRVNPVLWLIIVTCASGTTAPVGSVMVPKTVASWVCDHAHSEKKTNAIANPTHLLFLFCIPASITLSPGVVALEQNKFAELSHVDRAARTDESRS